MSFWLNVQKELEFRNISRKELAFALGMNKMTIHKAIERDSMPTADTALKIARKLGVSLEYLLDIEAKTASPTEISETAEALRLYKKYGSILKELESLSQREFLAISALIGTLAG